MTTNPAAGVPYYVRALAFGIPAILLGLQLSGWIAFIPVIKHGHFDFRAYYTAGYMVRSGQVRHLYDYEAEKAIQDRIISREQLALPFTHPAYEALLFAPLSLAPWRVAYLILLAINLSLLGVSLHLLRPQMQNLARIYRWLPAAMFFLFLPVAVTLMQEQDSILLLTLLTAAAVSLDGGRDLAAGIIVGLGLFRFQLVIPIALLFLLWRRWRFTAGFALSGVTVTSISLWLVGPSQTKIYVRSLLGMAATNWDDPLHMSSLRGLVTGLAGNHLPSILIAATIAVLSVALLVWAASKGTTNALPVAITVAVVISYHSLSHDLSVLLIPISVTLNRFIGAEATEDRSGRLIARVSALVFVAPICMSFSPQHFYLVALPLLAFVFLLAERSGWRPDARVVDVPTTIQVAGS